MDPQRWARIKDLFHAALAYPPEQRAAFLRQATGDDKPLREEVESMLARQAGAARFLETPALVAAAMDIAGELDRSGTSVATPPVPPLPAHSRPLDSATVTRLQRRVSTRPPWWIIALSIIFVADALVRTWCHVVGPEGFGFTTEVKGGRYVVTEVTPGSLAEAAGIRPGDVIVARDGQPYERVSNRWVTRPNLEVGRTYRFEVERDGTRIGVAIPMRRLPALRGFYGEARVLWQVAMLAMLATALLVAFRRPRDPLASLGALTLASLSVSFWLFNLPGGYAVAWRSAPLGLGALLLISNLGLALAGPIGLTFFLLFPRSLFRARWPWAIVWLPGLCLLPVYVHDTLLIVYRPEAAYARIAPEITHPIQGGVFTLYGLAMLGAVIANYFRLTDRNEKRRVRVLVAGGAAGTIPGLARLVIVSLSPSPSALYDYVMYGWPDIVIVVGFLLFPISFAYALLRHRVLGVRVIVRMGVQYALARGLAISLVPALGLILVADALIHGDQPLIEIVRARGWIYAVLAGLAGLAHSQRRRMATAIDQRFFREHYDSRHLLRDVAEQARRSGSLEAAASAVVARIEAALHPAFTAIFVRATGEATFRPIASTPAGANPPAITETSALVAQLRTTEKPLQTTGWQVRYRDETELPDAEDRLSRIELAVPIVVSAEHHEALLAFGPKRSEEPYTPDDVDALVAIAASLALLLDRSPSESDRTTSTFGECPACGACYDSGAERCAREDSSLVSVGMPRVFAGRYRIERRLGRGGMGKVYEAADTALGRRVAIKVIREEWVHSSPAITRFRREARAVAGLDHPNVVTVHDYGVETGRRAFIVMELLHGATLRDEIRQSGSLGPARTVDLFRGVCSAVDAAHRHRIVHRDLKPENIFLVRAAGDSAATVKVLDFGVAKPLAAMGDETEGGAAETAMGVLVGTVGYMSPGQLLGESPDVSWDLWALAVVAYECLAGALPFPVVSRESWRQLVLAGRFTPLVYHLPDAPAAWQAFFDECLASDRGRRPRSAAELFGHLETALRLPVGPVSPPFPHIAV